MIRYILDTDTLSLIQRNDADVVAFLYTLPVEEIATTVITYIRRKLETFSYSNRRKVYLTSNIRVAKFDKGFRT
jgi:hypothetical protein